MIGWSDPQTRNVNRSGVPRSAAASWSARGRGARRKPAPATPLSSVGRMHFGLCAPSGRRQRCRAIACHRTPRRWREFRSHHGNDIISAMHPAPVSGLWLRRSRIRHSAGRTRPPPPPFHLVVLHPAMPTGGVPLARNPAERGRGCTRWQNRKVLTGGLAVRQTARVRLETEWSRLRVIVDGVCLSNASSVLDTRVSIDLTR